MRAPLRKKGQYFIPGGHYDVVIAITEGACPWLTLPDVRLLGFLARAKDGWGTRGGDLSLDWIATRLRISLRQLKRSLAHLKRRGMIEARRSPLRTHLSIAPKFAQDCALWLELNTKPERFSKAVDLITRQDDGPREQALLDKLIILTITCKVEADDHELLQALLADQTLRRSHLRCPDDPEAQERLEYEAKRYRWVAGG